MSDTISILPIIEALERSRTSARIMCCGVNAKFELWIKSGQLVHWESVEDMPTEQLLGLEIDNLWIRSFAQAEFNSSKQPVKLYELVKKFHDLEDVEQQPETRITSKSEKEPPKDKNGVAPADTGTAEGKSVFNLPKPVAATTPQAFTATEKLPPEFSKPGPMLIAEFSDRFDAETAPVPSGGHSFPPPPAKPIKSDNNILPPKPIVPEVENSPTDRPEVGLTEKSLILDKKDSTDDDSSEHGDVIVFAKGRKDRRVMGRAEDCDIVIKDSGSSRKHCEFFFDGNLIHVKDLNSSNGTYLNHKQVHMAVADDGDTIEIGDMKFTLKIDQAPVSQSA